MTQVDPQAVKEQQRKDWGQSAEGWKKNDERLRTVTAPVTQRLLGLAAIAPGSRVLDIACGTGQPAIPEAELVGSAGAGPQPHDREPRHASLDRKLRHARLAGEIDDAFGVHD